MLYVLSRVLVCLAIVSILSPKAHAASGGVEVIGNKLVVPMFMNLNADQPAFSAVNYKDRILITMAHWQDDVRPGMNIYAGIPGEDGRVASQRKVKVIERFADPKYAQEGRFSNDISVFLLESSIGVGQVARIATLEEVKTWTQSKAMVSHFGYGFHSKQERDLQLSGSGKTKFAPTEIQVPLTDDGGLFPGYNLNKMAFSSISLEKSICGGDSGGPVVKSENGKYLLIGVNSSTNGAGCTNYDANKLVATFPIVGEYLGLIARAEFRLAEIEADEKKKDIFSSPSPVPSTSPSPLPTPTPSPSPRSTPSSQTAKSTTITCFKGKIVKKITSTAGKCPAGYKKR